MSKLFFFIFLIYFSFFTFSYAQNSEDLDSKNREKILKQAEAMKKAGLIDPNLDLENSEDAQKAQKQIAENLQKMVGKDGKLKLDPKKLKQMMALSTAVFKDKTEAQVKSDIMSRFKSGSFIHSFLTRNPKVLLFCARMLRDSHALPSLSEIVTNKVHLGMYTGFVLVTFIFGFAWKRWEAKSALGIVQRIFRTVIRFSVINVIRLIGFYFLFPKEVGPTWNIFKGVFFNG